MPNFPIFAVEALNLRVSPFLQNNGQVLRAVNVERDRIGCWKKRSGYVTYLNDVDANQVNSLFSWQKNSGTESFVYRTSGNLLYHSLQGTGNWTISGNGTIGSAGKFGHTVLDDVLIGGDGELASRHSTNGTSFTDTTGAPLARYWEEYESRVWAGRGTAVTGANTDLFFSTTGTATDWTTDSSSIRIPGEGQINGLFKAGDRLFAAKDSGNMFRYDGFSLVDLATNLAPTSAYSVGHTEGFRMGLNRLGVYGFGNARPELLSSPIERLIFNDAGSAIVGTEFDAAPGICYRYDYFVSVGTITEDLTGLTIPDAIPKYDFQLDEWNVWTFANKPTAFGTYQDTGGNDQLIFGDSSGQCYQLAGTALTDNGNAISSELMGFIHLGTLDEKKWKRLLFMFNPGCEAQVQYCITDTFSPRTYVWQNLPQAIDGVVEGYMPEGSRGRFCFWRITDTSSTARFHLNALEYEADIIRH